MEPINVRLLVTRDGVETQVETQVNPDTLLAEMNSQFFPDVPASAKIQWIYIGRPLKEKLPTAIQPGSAFHVYALLYFALCMFVDSFRSDQLAFPPLAILQ